jgi:S-adenosylmethionine synthetase
MFPIVISSLQTAGEVEIVERKGIGHPDTICDALAETLSRNLSGLSAGDHVILHPRDRIKKGVAVSERETQ